nr:GAF domain-containing protein [Texcoconibacillus texcoconensis]
MSIATDIASLQIMADVYKKKQFQEIAETSVNSLVNQVPHIDWAGIFLFDQDQSAECIASSDEENNLEWTSNAELKFTIEDGTENEIGVLVVRSREAIAFDVTDFKTLETIAKSLGEISLNN